MPRPMEDANEALILEQHSRKGVRTLMAIIKKIYMTKDIHRLRVEIESDDEITLKEFLEEPSTDTEPEPTDDSQIVTASVDGSTDDAPATEEPPSQETEPTDPTPESAEEETATAEEVEAEEETTEESADADEEDNPDTIPELDEYGITNPETQQEIANAFMKSNSNSLKALNGILQLDYDDGITRSQLSEKIKDMAGLSSYLSKLEEKGMLTHTEGNGRGYKYFITSKGEAAVKYHRSSPTLGLTEATINELDDEQTSDSGFQRV